MLRSDSGGRFGHRAQDTSLIKVVNITCGKYVGTGNLLGATPDPLKGECAACHAGQLGWLADFANPWKETGHAHMCERMIDDPAAQAKGHGVDAFKFGSSYSIDSRSMGWSRLTAGTNDGWAQVATSEGYVLPGTT